MSQGPAHSKSEHAVLKNSWEGVGTKPATSHQFAGIGKIWHLSQGRAAATGGQEGSLRHVGSLTCTRHCVCATRHTQQTGLERAGSPWSQVREKPSARPRWQSHTGGCRAVNSICPGAKLVPLSPQHLLQTEGFLASALLTSVAASLSVVGAIHES